jgi:thiosulfate/3-mercaptopyruvate sulfurtransferase
VLTPALHLRDGVGNAFDLFGPVIVYCFKGARASNTFVALEEAGIKDVGIYFGSWNEWSRDPSLPIEEGLTYPAARLAA